MREAGAAMCKQFRDAGELENNHVHEVYRKIAPFFHNAKYKAWPIVRQFLNRFPKSSLILDVGCGNGKYAAVEKDIYFIGCDVCADLVNMAGKHQCSAMTDFMLADNLSLPFKDECFDAVISVAVIHHFSTPARRLRAVSELARCVRRGGQLLVCVWALEQDERKFCAQDVLVPWHRNQQMSSDLWTTAEDDEMNKQPVIRFHMDSTKEQRIIAGSVQIQPPRDTVPKSSWLPTIQLMQIWSKMTSENHNCANPNANHSHTIWDNPSAFATNTLITGISKLHPGLGKRLVAYFYDPCYIYDRISEQLAARIMNQVFSELKERRKRNLTYYRYYHVFRSGELDELIEEVEILQLLDVSYDHANWCAIAQRY